MTCTGRAAGPGSTVATRSFSELRFEVHENVGVFVEGELVALRTIISGTHAGDYVGTAAAGSPIQTGRRTSSGSATTSSSSTGRSSTAHRILAAVGASPGVASVFQDRVLGVPASPSGLFEAPLVTEFGTAAGRPAGGEAAPSCAAYMTGSAPPPAPERPTWSPRTTSRTLAGPRTLARLSQAPRADRSARSFRPVRLSRRRRCSRRPLGARAHHRVARRAARDASPWGAGRWRPVERRHGEVIYDEPRRRPDDSARERGTTSRSQSATARSTGSLSAMLDRLTAWCGAMRSLRQPTTAEGRRR
jgi:hypothetical protein